MAASQQRTSPMAAGSVQTAAMASSVDESRASALALVKQIRPLVRQFTGVVEDMNQNCAGNVQGRVAQRWRGELEAILLRLAALLKDAA